LPSFFPFFNFSFLIQIASTFSPFVLIHYLLSFACTKESTKEKCSRAEGQASKCRNLSCKRPGVAIRSHQVLKAEDSAACYAKSPLALVLRLILV
jgi:hypothetical protein